MKRSLWSTAAVVLLVALLFSACGSGDSKDSASGDGSSTTASADGRCITVPNRDGSFQRVKDAGELKLGAVDGLLPYSSSADTDPGFEIEMGDYVAKQLCVEPKTVFVSWAGLIPALEANRFDAVFDGLFITPEREKEVNFSEPYYASGETIVVAKGNPEGIEDLADLKDKTVGVLAGSVTVDAIRSVGAKEVKTYDDQNQILLEIGNGRIDAGYLEAPSSAWVLRQQPELKAELVRSYVPDERFNAGVAVRKSDGDLLAAIDLALERMIERRARDEIFARYGVPYFPTN